MTRESDLFHRAEEIFLHICSLPEPGRATALAEACGADAALAHEVRSLLDHAGRLSGFLEQPALGAAFGLPAGEGDELVGRQVGRYRVERCIGSGGMGTVYLATRADEQFTQRVAIKVVKRGMDSDEILRRFRAERQTLAALHHPHIALLLDGGATDAGQPYLVMEYVEGEPIDRYCDRHRLTIEDRLQLFLVICDAVRHAHQNLVIHRDLKPANILVSHDGIPKLVDFGIAKLVAPGELARTTTPNERRLTPEYASPEQVTGRLVGTASDVYSLGVILYELLCGHQPYRFPTRTPEEIERVVAQGPTPLPSESVGRVEPRTDRPEDGDITPELVAVARSVRPEALRRHLRGDLDTIVLMALRKEPERRYASVEHLASDIRHVLAGLPVSAHRDTFGYRLAKFARRHRIGTALGLLALMLLAGAIGMVVWQARVASAQRDAAVTARDQAEATVAFLQQMLGSVDPGASGRDVTVREVLDAAAGRVETELASQPLVQAGLRSTIGRTYLSLGLMDQAEVQLRRALEQRLALLGPHAHDVAASQCDVAELLYARQSLDEAEALLRGALATMREVSGERSAEAARTLSSLGAVLCQKGELPEAEASQRQALAISREVTGPDSLDVAVSLNNLCGVFLAQDRLDEAVPCLTEALDIRRARLGERHPLVAESLDNLAVVLHRQGDVARAESLYRESLALELDLLGKAHPEVAVTQKNLAVLYLQRGDLPQAEEQFRACLATREACFPPTDWRVFLTQIDLADVLAQRGEWDEAAQLLQRALESARAASADADKLGRAFHRAAEVFAAHGDGPRAAELLDEASAATAPATEPAPR